MKKNLTLIIAIILIISFGVVWKFNKKNTSVVVTNFAECVAAGNPVLESYPRQCQANGQVYTEEIEVQSAMTESQARVIAEKTCIKGGEALASGYYNSNSKTWWFDANLNSTKEGCNPACVVSEETSQAEINWRCTGALVPSDSVDEITKLFADKYPTYTDTFTVRVNQESGNFARGGVSFVLGEPGGNFLAAKINGKWQVVFDGNGQIPCSLSSYGFPDEMLSDCSQ